MSFEIERGAYAAIVGESGSGKTTLMHVLGALDRATAGGSRWQAAIWAAKQPRIPAFRAHEVGFVFQGFN